MEEQAKDLAAGKEAPQAGRAAPAADPAEERAFARAIILATKITLSGVLTPIAGGEPNSSGNLEIIQSGVTITDDNAACETALTLVVGGAENAYTLTKLGSTSKLIAKDDKKV